MFAPRLLDGEAAVLSSVRSIIPRQELHVSAEPDNWRFFTIRRGVFQFVWFDLSISVKYG
jgi:hypothetical protein